MASRPTPAALPIVAVTATTEELRGAPRVRVNEAYVRALVDAGLVPVVLPPLLDDAAADAVLAAVHGLVLTGGEDIDPARYGAPAHPALGAVHAGRDASELALARAAARRRTPTLAICRGAQLLNVALGGTLLQDIPTEVAGAPDHDPPLARGAHVHPVRVEPGSRLAAIVATADDGLQPTVNSTHHQSVQRVAPSLRVTAHAPDGVVEAIESPDESWWLVGVQWHPEEPIGHPAPADAALFQAFARAVRASVAGRRD